MMKWLCILSGTLALSGCAPYQLPPLRENHPAYVGVMPTQQRTVSETLVYTRADVPSPQPTQDSRPESDHGGAPKMVTGEGKVVATVPSSNQLVVDHGEIKGFMDAMTMGYSVEPPSQLEGIKPGDRVRFTIDVPKKTIVKIEKLK